RPSAKPTRPGVRRPDEQPGTIGTSGERWAAGMRNGGSYVETTRAVREDETANDHQHAVEPHDGLGVNGGDMVVRDDVDDVVGLVVGDAVRPAFRGAGPHDRCEDEERDE